METIDNSNKARNNNEYSLVGAFTLIGLGIGLYFKQVAAGIMIGIGTGLLLTTLYRMNQK